MGLKDLYSAELTATLSRFVEGSFTSQPTRIIQELPSNCYIFQNIIGEYEAITAIYGSPDAILKFAVKYSQMELEEGSEVIDEIAADFLNMQNGLFVVKLSNEEKKECSLSPPTFHPEFQPSLDGKIINIIPIDFNFGSICFVFAE